MSAVVLKIVPDAVASSSVKQSVVQLLTDALKDAKAGNITGLFLLVCHPNGTWGPHWTGDIGSDTMLGRMGLATRHLEKLIDESNNVEV